MSENVFRFFRGTNHIFYEDLESFKELPHSPLAWISGDLHLENFGTFRSDNRLVYFDLNDFDEALLAPCLYELTRIVTSIFVAFDALHIEQKRALKMAALFIKIYAKTLTSQKPNYIEPQTAKGIVREFLIKVSKQKQESILRKRTLVRKKRLEIMLDDPRHFKLKKKIKNDLFEHMTDWLKNDGNSPYNYEVIDGVFRLAGTGSVGVKRYAFLLKSLNKEGEKYILIDMKQCVKSSLVPYVKAQQPHWESEAQRVVTIQQRMQNRPPALLSTSFFKGDCYVMQEMQPTKDSINFKLIRKEYRNMYQVIDDMAMLTASSQLRSTGRQGSAIADELSAFGQDEKWQSAILEYARDYSLQVRKHYMEYLTDLENGFFQKALLKSRSSVNDTIIEDTEKLA
jgi:uncharacterized protein (DUF2252 family)